MAKKGKKEGEKILGPIFKPCENCGGFDNMLFCQNCEEEVDEYGRCDNCGGKFVKVMGCPECDGFGAEEEYNIGDEVNLRVGMRSSAAIKKFANWKGRVKVYKGKIVRIASYESVVIKVRGVELEVSIYDL